MPQDTNPRRIIIAADHAGFDLKEFLVKQRPDISWTDLGPHNTERVDYPDFADLVAQKVIALKALGILVCGSGQGMCMRANKYLSIRAALCWDPISAQLARSHNDANILCMGSRLLPFELALEILDVFIKTEFEGGRHLQRIQKMALPPKL